MTAVFKRELRAYFTSPLGYIVMIVYLMLYGDMFVKMYQSGIPETGMIFSYYSVITAFLIPILTMRLFSEERRQRTDQALFTAPVTLTGIVMGKFLAALTVYGLSQAVTLLYHVVFAFNTPVDWIGFFIHVFGTLLMASALISVGLFISCLTDSQIVSAVVSLAASVLLFTVDGLISSLDNKVVVAIVEWISFPGRYQSFIEGVFDIANTVFFISFAAIFLFLTVRVQESKRWA